MVIGKYLNKQSKRIRKNNCTRLYSEMNFQFQFSSRDSKLSKPAQKYLLAAVLNNINFEMVTNPIYYKIILSIVLENQIFIKLSNNQ